MQLVASLCTSDQLVKATSALAQAIVHPECSDSSFISRKLPDLKLTTTFYSFLRFSTVQGARGSADTVRDVRGFAVRFYTDEGNWDSEWR